MADFKETAVGYLDVDNYASFDSSERKWINKILTLKEKYPDEVKIIKMPDDNCGSIAAHIPKSWLKVNPPKKMNFTDEQKAARAERMRQNRKYLKQE